MKSWGILFISSAHEMSATYFRAFFLAKHLAQRQHRVLLIASSRKSTLEAERKFVDGVNVFLLPSLVVFDANIFLNQISRIATSLMQTMFNCALERMHAFNVLHSFDVAGLQNAAPTMISKISRLFKITNNTIFVDWDEWWGQGGLLSMMRGMYSVLSPLIGFLEEKIPLSADAVTVPTEPLQERARNVGVGPENLYLIPNGCNTDFIRPLDMHEAREKLNLPIKNIIYTQVGLLDREPLKLLIQAHKKVLTHHSDALLLLVGLNSDQTDFVKSFKLANIIYAGRQPYQKIPLYLAASDVMLLPFADTPFDRGRGPLRLGDYLAAGRPIVATSLPETRKIVGKCGLLAKPDSSVQFAEKMLEMIENPELRKKNGERARWLAEKYSWKICAQQLEAAYSHFL